jgi:hypothetical protein
VLSRIFRIFSRMLVALMTLVDRLGDNLWWRHTWGRRHQTWCSVVHITYYYQERPGEEQHYIKFDNVILKYDVIGGCLLADQPKSSEPPTSGGRYVNALPVSEKGGTFQRWRVCTAVKTPFFSIALTQWPHFFTIVCTLTQRPHIFHILLSPNAKNQALTQWPHIWGIFCMYFHPKTHIFHIFALTECQKSCSHLMAPYFFNFALTVCPLLWKFQPYTYIHFIFKWTPGGWPEKR